MLSQYFPMSKSDECQPKDQAKIHCAVHWIFNLRKGFLLSKYADCQDDWCHTLLFSSENIGMKNNSFILDWQSCILNLLSLIWTNAINPLVQVFTQHIKSYQFPGVMSKHAMSGTVSSVCCWTWFDPHEGEGAKYLTLGVPLVMEETAFWRWLSSNMSPVSFPGLLWPGMVVLVGTQEEI